jgi:hypothetical protein
MMFKELSKFMDFIIGLGLFHFNRNIISVIEWKGRLVSCLRMLDNRTILSEIALFRCHPIHVVVVL